MKATDCRPLDVLRNLASGELGLVVEIAGDKVCLADKEGRKNFFRPGDQFEFVPREESGAFTLGTLAVLRDLRRQAGAPKRVTRVQKAATPRRNARRR